MTEQERIRMAYRKASFTEPSKALVELRQFARDYRVRKPQASMNEVLEAYQFKKNSELPTKERRS